MKSLMHHGHIVLKATCHNMNGGHVAHLELFDMQETNSRNFHWLHWYSCLLKCQYQNVLNRQHSPRCWPGAISAWATNLLEKHGTSSEKSTHNDSRSSVGCWLQQWCQRGKNPTLPPKPSKHINSPQLWNGAHTVQMGLLGYCLTACAPMKGA